MVIMLFTSLLSAQRGYNDRNNSYTSYYYASNTAYGDEYRGDSYRNYDRYRSSMDRYERKKLKNLVNDLRREERRAWKDGHLSRRDRKRIGEAEYRIDRFLSQFDTRNRRSRSCR